MAVGGRQTVERGFNMKGRGGQPTWPVLIEYNRIDAAAAVVDVGCHGIRAVSSPVHQRLAI